MSNSPLNLSSLNSEEFEDLVEALFRAKMPPKAKADMDSIEAPFVGTVTEVSRSGRGQDGGLDILVTTMVRDCIASRLIRWVVQLLTFQPRRPAMNCTWIF